MENFQNPVQCHKRRRVRPSSFAASSDVNNKNINTSSHAWRFHNIAEIVDLSMGPVTLLLHSLGAFLISCLIQNGNHKTQQLFLLNYSLSVIVVTFVNVIGSLVHRYAHEEKIHLFFKVITCTLYYIFFCSMIFINLDRLLEVLLNIKYPVYVTKNRTICIIVLSWFIVAGTFVPLAVTEDMYIFYTYIATPMDIIYMVFAAITWMIIFYFFKKFRIPPTSRNSSTTISIGATFRQSKFAVPLVLVISFVTCTILPDIVVIIMGGFCQECLQLIVNFGFYIESIIDALLYINLDRQIRRLLWKKLRVNRLSRQINPRQRMATETVGSTRKSRHWDREN